MKYCDTSKEIKKLEESHPTIIMDVVCHNDLFSVISLIVSRHRVSLMKFL